MTQNAVALNLKTKALDQALKSASWDQTLKVWDGRTEECLATLYADGPLRGCVCSADGLTIVAAGARGVYFLRLVR